MSVEKMKIIESKMPEVREEYKNERDAIDNLVIKLYKLNIGNDINNPVIKSGSHIRYDGLELELRKDYTVGDFIKNIFPDINRHKNSEDINLVYLELLVGRKNDKDKKYVIFQHKGNYYFEIRTNA